ncbi:hypothetical protein C1H46_009170 [Malus baccata]|uniref:Uncharacterized protein n=1 Tax=Malus baccata TaxID=106549 RepID=A0A540N2B5_MALBA|nr:hypothetical protein C1H46_009170 [Malus baccata]
MHAQKAGIQGYKKNRGWFSCIFPRMPLEKSGLEPALKALKEKLIITKNVAEAVAEELCGSMAASLEGKKLPWFKTISSAVQAAMEESTCSYFNNCGGLFVRPSLLEFFCPT